jgi:hypothetical protein
MGGDLLGVLDGTALFEVGGDAGRPEGVVAIRPDRPVA